MPKQRALSPDALTQVRDAIDLKANSKLIQRKIQQSTGKNVTLKNISNIRQYQENCVSKNNIDPAVGFLKQKEGSITYVLIDCNQNFKALFYQDKHMFNLYERYPQLLLVHATYKLLDLRLPVYLLLVIDSNGLSEIAGLFIVAEETKVLIEEVVTVFSAVFS